jgi:hypothetical protein
LFAGAFALTAAHHVWHRRYIRNLAERLRRRFDLERRSSDDPKGIAIAGVIDGVEVTLTWSRIQWGNSALDIVARYPGGLAEAVPGLRGLDRGLPLGIRARREGDEIRIHVGYKQVVVFPTRHISRWVGELIGFG